MGGLTGADWMGDRRGGGWVAVGLVPLGFLWCGYADSE